MSEPLDSGARLGVGVLTIFVAYSDQRNSCARAVYAATWNTWACNAASGGHYNDSVTRSLGSARAGLLLAALAACAGDNIDSSGPNRPAT